MQSWSTVTWGTGNAKRESLLCMHVSGNHLQQVSWVHRRKPADRRNAFQWPVVTKTNLWHAVKWWEAHLDTQDSWVSFIAGFGGQRSESFQAGLLVQYACYTAGTESVFPDNICEMKVWLKSTWATETAVQFACLSGGVFGINTQVESKDDFLQGIVVHSR